MECNEEDKDMVAKHAVREVAKDLVEIETVFVQRANAKRNPLSGEELLKESVKLLMELRVKGEIRD